MPETKRWGSIPGSGRSPGGGHGNPLQYSCLENPHGQKSLAGYSPWGCTRVGHNWNDLACRMHEQTESLYICLLTAVALGSSWGQLLRSPVSLLLQGLTRMIELPSQAKHSGVWDWQWAIISELRGVRVANQQGASSPVLDRHCLAPSS